MVYEAKENETVLHKPDDQQAALYAHVIGNMLPCRNSR